MLLRLLNHYLLLGFIGLSLTGCNQEPMSQEASSDTRQSADKSSVLSNGTDDLDDGHRTAAKQPANKFSMPASHSVGSSMRKQPSVFRRKRRPALLVSMVEQAKPAVRSSSLADASASDNMQGNGPREVVEAGTLRQFLNSRLMAAQVFTLYPGHDTLLLSAQGTQIFVPADAWDLPATAEPLQLRLQEFYSLPDMLLAGLSTTASGQLLETGCMLHLTASTVAGQNVAVRSGSSLRLRMPTKEIKPDMQLFMGQHSVGQINWQLDSAGTSTPFVTDAGAFSRAGRKRRKRIQHKTLRDEWPEYLGGERRQRRELVRDVTYPLTTISKFRRNSKRSFQERRALLSYNTYIVNAPGKQEKARRIAEIEFMVDTTGSTTNVKVRNGYDAELAAPVMAAVSKWQHWTPARLSRPSRAWAPQTDIPAQYASTKRKVTAVGRVRVLISVSGKILVSPPAWDYRATNELLQTKKAAEDLAKYRNRVRAAAYRRDSVLRAGGMLAEANGLALTSEALYYELNSAGLGWINCDRFMQSTQPLFVYEVDAAAPDAQVMMVFRSIGSIMAGKAIGSTGRMAFAQVPKGTQATVVAIRWQQGQAYLATQQTVLTTHPISPLSYRPVSILELQTALAAIE